MQFAVSLPVVILLMVAGGESWGEIRRKGLRILKRRARSDGFSSFAESCGSSSAGVKGRGCECRVRRSEAEVLLLRLLLAECRLGVVGRGGTSLNRLSR